MLPVFYINPDSVSDETIVIGGEEARHLVRVMRLGRGETVIAVDGRGTGFKCEIEKVSEKSVTCRVFATMRNFGEPLHFVTLAAGLSTGFKFDDVVQRGTELGISRFVPLITEKSKIKIDEEEGQSRKLERWRKVATASMRQTSRACLPDITPFCELDRLFTRGDRLGRILLFDTAGERRLDEIVWNPEERFLTLLIGPESGFSRAEVELAREMGAEIIGLGGRILRTENAGPAAAALVMNYLGELR